MSTERSIIKKRNKIDRVWKDSFEWRDKMNGRAAQFVRIVRIFILIIISVTIACCNSQNRHGENIRPADKKETTQLDKQALKEKIAQNRFCPDGYEALFTHGNLHDIEIVMTKKGILLSAVLLLLYNGWS